MAHIDELGREEFLANPLHREIAKRIGEHHQGTGRPPREYRILDWGCGRGKDVLHLLQQGFDAHGVDISEATMNRGRSLFKAMGHDFDNRIQGLGDTNRTSLPDASLDFIFSYYVFEHVADLGPVIAEMARITRPGGAGLHIIPGKHRLMEGHLKMPLVHWLPKCGLRRAWIRLCVAMGMDPQWKEVATRPPAGRVDWYYRYINNQTFYRSLAEIRRAFGENGFTCRELILEHERIRNSLPGRLTPKPVLRLLEPLVATMTSSVLLVRKN